MNPLKDLCNEVLRLQTEDQFFEISAYASPKLARACLVLLEALECDSDYCELKDPCYPCEALAKAQAIVGEK